MEARRAETPDVAIGGSVYDSPAAGGGSPIASFLPERFKGQSDNMFKTDAPSGVEVQNASRRRRIIRDSRAFDQQVTEPFQASKPRVKVSCPKDGAKRVPAARRKEPRSRKSRDHIGCQLSFRKGSHQQQGLAVLLLKPRQGFPDLKLGFAPCQPKTTPVPLNALGPWPAHGRADTKYPRFRVPFE
jgi:hypothetical protein